MESVLVTGAYGFLGKYILKELKENGYKVIAFGRKPEKLEQFKENNIDIFMGDFCNKNDIIEATKNVDYVIHSGALSSEWGKRADFIKTNVEGTKNVIEACKLNNVKRMVYISSPSIYSGKKHRLDINEQDYDKNNKLNYYIESKILAENAINEEKNLQAVIIRPRGLIGIGDTSLIPRIMNANKKTGIPLFNGGKNIVDITCVENVALACRLCLESEVAVGNTYNITNGEPTEFKKILEEFFSQLEEEPKYLKINLNFMYAMACIIEGICKLIKAKEPILTKYNICTLGFSQTLNIEKARKDLNYKPKITLSEGIKKYAEHCKKNKVL